MIDPAVTVSDTGTVIYEVTTHNQDFPQCELTDTVAVEFCQLCTAPAGGNPDIFNGNKIFFLCPKKILVFHSLEITYK